MPQNNEIIDINKQLKIKIENLKDQVNDIINKL